MKNNDQKITGEMHFYELYTPFTDVQILDILKHHKSYQKAAIDAAVKIAIERQLIYSEQDLLAPEFQNSKPIGFTMFPTFDNDYHRQRLIGSTFRLVYILSLMPVIYGFLKYGEGELNQTYLGVGIGIIWFLLGLILNKTHKLIVLIPMFVLLLSVSVVIGTKIFSNESFKILDLVMLLIGTLLPVYFLFLLKKLIQQKTDNT